MKQSFESAPAPGRYNTAGLGRLRGRVTAGRYTGVLIALILVMAYLTMTQPAFATWPNFMNIARSNSVLLTLAVGATFVIISAGIDLSVSSTMAASGMVLGLCLQEGWSAPAAVGVTLAFAASLGLLIGATISWLKISFLVVTLGGLSIYQSFALVVTDGTTISVFGLRGFEPIQSFVNGELLGVPYLLLFDIALLLVAGAILRYTRFGRTVFAVGSNPEAARLNGVNVAVTTLLVYTFAAFCAGMGSVIHVGRLTGASPTADPTLLMTVVTAVLIGGTAYTGGEGGVLGTAVAVVFLGVVQNGLTLSGIDTFWQGMVTGLILIVAVGLEVFRRRRRRPGRRLGSPTEMADSDRSHPVAVR